MALPASMYRIFRRPDGEAPSVRIVIIAMVLVALMLTAIGVIRVTRQHEVLRLGLSLSKKSEDVRRLRETRRQLELELATLTAPDRIRRLATQLGMTSVPPDKIRVIAPRPNKVASR
ncbi:MAG: cell division protein FtsL [Deltaproteobacteria bacterium]|nr:cell division protein FtsL [Deltaproteobacteria bacterium]